MIRFIDLLLEAGVRPDETFGNAEIDALTADSRKAVPGAVFVSMPSNSGSSTEYAQDAIDRGVAAVVCGEAKVAGLARDAGVPFALYHTQDKFQEACWRIAKRFFGNPSASMKVYGITGTNGKTTTAWILRDALQWLGRRAAYVGTLGIKTDRLTPLANTTPFAIELLAHFAELQRDGIQDVAIEISSHALAEKRADGLEFDVGVFTNLTQDHMDFHGTMEAYEIEKRRLFFDVPKNGSKTFLTAANADDPAGARIAGEFGDRCVSFGLEKGDLRAQPRKLSVDRTEMLVEFHGQEATFDFPLGGRFNVENVLAATGALLAVGYDLDAAAAAMGHVTPAPGRFEPVHSESGIGVIVDYAHTPDALAKVLGAARDLSQGRLIVVFGCGGDRDTEKRPQMGRIASDLADSVIVTNDNPRSESPDTIVADILAGVSDSPKVSVVLDRREAVRQAIHQANPGDIVVLAGKGHETYQIVGKERFELDDRVLAREALSSR